MKNILVSISIILLPVLFSTTAKADELADLLARVGTLNISRQDYTLGKVLTDGQKKKARQNTIEHTSPGTYKFKDKDLYIVVDRTTDRVLIIYEQYESVAKKRIRELVGSLFLDFGDPTLLAHDKIIYWVFDEKGKVLDKDYQKIKKQGRQLKTLATVKLNSSLKIVGNNTHADNGSVYYIISSEPVLKLIKSQEK